jgi:osmotically-inducible protein OsmY
MGTRPRYWLAVLVAALLCGCSAGDTDHLSQIGRKVAARLETFTAGREGKLNRGWAAFRNGWDDDPLDSRVSLRLRWDKELSDCKIEVLCQGAKIELSGLVPDQAAHQRAIEIAQTTCGVESVADWLEEAHPDPEEKR